MSLDPPWSRLLGKGPVRLRGSKSGVGYQERQYLHSDPVLPRRPSTFRGVRWGVNSLRGFIRLYLRGFIVSMRLGWWTTGDCATGRIEVLGGRGARSN